MKKRISALIGLILCLWLSLCPVFAASTTEATAPILTTKACSLTVTCRNGNDAFPGISLPLYKVASVSEDFQYSYTPDFASCGLRLNGLTAQSEWDALRTTLEAMTLSDSISPTVAVTTDSNGTAVFSNLTPGLYFIPAFSIYRGEARISFSSVLVAVPGLRETDGQWEYDVTVFPKSRRFSTTTPSDDTQYQVVKLWKGTGKRPGSITVSIFCDGSLAETVTLSEKNNWSYSWKASDDCRWNVLEQSVPSGYTMSVSEQGNTFYITNIAANETPSTPSKSPYTGDQTPLGLWVMLLSISGLVLVVLGLTGRRNTP